MVIKRIFIGILLGIGSVGAVLIYKYFDPVDYALFPKCPLKHLTGLDCPGCGSQRALHHLLNGEVEKSFWQNPLLFLLVPYLLLGFYLHLVPSPTFQELKLRKLLYGYRAIQVLFVVIVTFTILRNIV